MIREEAPVAVLGLGYVGLPLAVAFGSSRPTLGFDVDAGRVAELNRGHDRTLEVTDTELVAATKLRFSSSLGDLDSNDVYIVAVPTPIDEAKRPNLRPLISASAMVGKALSPGNIVVFESTVYPGATEEVCVPILEQESGLVFNKDFFVGYSPERVNPGDRTHRVTDIRKVTSGSTPGAAEAIDDLYRSIIRAGTHKASSIKVAEAAKVIENTQRDVNIALINELAMLFNKLGIDTNEVLEAAGTKWNFLPFRPGLVGGHCIGVDPYYLTYKAQEVGHHPEVMLAGRRINDAMGEYVADQVVLEMAGRRLPIAGGRVLVLGLAFKEDTPDVRNTRVVDLVNKLQRYGIEVAVTDPWVEVQEAKAEYDIDVIPLESALAGKYDGVILAVAHREFINLAATARSLVTDAGVVYDIKGVWPLDLIDARL